MAAAVAVPVANAPPPLTTAVACSNEVMESWGRERLRGLPDGLNPEAIRAWRGRYGRTVWHQVAVDDNCGIDVCEWIYLLIFTFEMGACHVTAPSRQPVPRGAALLAASAGWRFEAVT